eukprot:5781454-Amphidinium_carterae.1
MLDSAHGQEPRALQPLHGCQLLCVPRGWTPSCNPPVLSKPRVLRIRLATSCKACLQKPTDPGPRHCQGSG